MYVGLLDYSAVREVKADIALGPIDPAETKNDR
jgi:hypothetical protein